MVRSDSRGSHTNTGLQPGLVVAMFLRCSCCLCDGKRCQDPQGGGKQTSPGDHCMSTTGGGRVTVRKPKMHIETPSPAVEQQRSTDIERCLASLVALNEPGAGSVHLVQRLLWFRRGHRWKAEAEERIRRRFAMKFGLTRGRNEVQNGVFGHSEM